MTTDKIIITLEKLETIYPWKASAYARDNPIEHRVVYEFGKTPGEALAALIFNNCNALNIELNFKQ